MSRQILRTLSLAALCLATPLACSSPTACEYACVDIRQYLVDTMGMDPEDIDCDDPKWEGDCQHCEELLQREYQVQVVGLCED